MNDCERIRARADAYLDGELEPAAREAVAAHLAGCPACAGYVRAERAFLERVASALEERAPDELRRRIEAILREEERAPVRPRRPRLRARWAMLLPLAAAVAAVLFVTRPWAGDRGAALAATDIAADHEHHAATAPSHRPFGPGDETPPPPPAIEGARVTGLSRCVVDGRAWAHYVLAVPGGLVSVFLPLSGEAPLPAGRAFHAHGATVVGVAPGPSAPGGAVLVSDDLSAGRLLELWRAGGRRAA